MTILFLMIHGKGYGRLRKIVVKVLYYIRSKWQVEPELIVSLKYYKLCILASDRKWEPGLIVMVRIVKLGIRWIGSQC